MKKSIALGAALLVIIALTVAAWFINNQFSNFQTQIMELQAKNDELQDQMSKQQQKINVKITNITLGNGGIVAGITYWETIDVLIQNIGPYDVGGITLTYNIVANQTIYYSFNWLEPDQMGIIHVGESKLIRINLETNLNELHKFSGQSLVIVLMLDNRVLDERTMVFPA